MLSKIVKILLISLGVPVLAFVGLVIYEITVGLPEPSSKALPTKSPTKVQAEKKLTPPKPPSETVKRLIACVFTRDPVETWPDETVSDPPIGNVELIKNVSIETYDVFGSNALEVKASMIEKGPTAVREKTPGVKTYVKVKATTTGSTRITWQPKNIDGGCILTGAKVTVDRTITLPEWVDKASASNQDQKMWDLFLKFLKRHEQGHVNISLKAYRDLQVELAQPISAPSCQELSDKIKTLRAALEQKRYQADTDYDNRTTSGLTQFPHEPNRTQPPFPFTCNWSEINI